ncbi:hypothetical protein [Chitinophaga caeni]|uniref:hypothetical protein n=1 Tax=Chitinophaga caeni TaxID=2029983 RepID=UPI001E5C0DCC|nr:hypothetical protein [Chitinophaga caeni]
MKVFEAPTCSAPLPLDTSLNCSSSSIQFRYALGLPEVPPLFVARNDVTDGPSNAPVNSLPATFPPLAPGTPDTRTLKISLSGLTSVPGLLALFHQLLTRILYLSPVITTLSLRILPISTGMVTTCSSASLPVKITY